MSELKETKLSNKSSAKCEDISSLEYSDKHLEQLRDLAKYIEGSPDIVQFNFFLTNSPEEVSKNTDKFPVVVVIQGEAEFCAYGHLEAFPGNARKKHVVKLGLYVKPEYRGNGYARRILDTLIEAACSKGYEKIWLSVYSDNLRAYELYKKAGFIEEGLFMNEEIWEGKHRHVISMAYFIGEEDDCSKEGIQD